MEAFIIYSAGQKKKSCISLVKKIKLGLKCNKIVTNQQVTMICLVLII